MGKVNKLRQKVKNAGHKIPQKTKPIEDPESEQSAEDSSDSDSDANNYENIRHKSMIKFADSSTTKRTSNKSKLANATDDRKIALVNRGPINKKEKLKSRHTNLLNKIKKIDQEKKKLLAKVKREKTVITGDLNPLKDALPSLDSLMKLKPNRDALKTGIGAGTPADGGKKPLVSLTNVAGEATDDKKFSKKVKKEMKRHKIKKLAKEYKQKFHHFQQVLKHDDFKLNPREAVATHIRLAMQDNS